MIKEKNGKVKFYQFRNLHLYTVTTTTTYMARNKFQFRKYHNAFVLFKLECSDKDNVCVRLEKVAVNPF